MKILVTGADGLLGSNLVRALLAKGHAVRVFVLAGSKSPTLDGLDIERVEGDLIAGGPVLAGAAAGRDAVFHLAAITDMWADTDLVWKVNFEGTRKVLDACVEAKVDRLVFVGSASSFAFGTIDAPGDETCPYPAQYKLIAYMESKHHAMKLVKEYAADKGLDAVVVSPTFMLGPHDSGPSSGELIRQFIKRGLRVVTPGGRNFAYAPDVADAAVSALDRGRTGEVYILGGENLTYLDFFGKVASIAGMEAPRVVIPGAAVMLGGALGSLYQKLSGNKAMLNLKMARLSLYGTYYSAKKAEAELGLRKTPVEKAIEDSIASLKQYGHLG